MNFCYIYVCGTELNVVEFELKFMIVHSVCNTLQYTISIWHPQSMYTNVYNDSDKNTHSIRKQRQNESTRKRI